MFTQTRPSRELYYFKLLFSPRVYLQIFLVSISYAWFYKPTQILPQQIVWLMSFKEMIVHYTQNDTKQIQNEKLLTFKAGGIYFRAFNCRLCTWVINNSSWYVSYVYTFSALRVVTNKHFLMVRSWWHLMICRTPYIGHITNTNPYNEFKGKPCNL